MGLLKTKNIIITSTIYILWVILFTVYSYHEHKAELYSTLDARLELAARNFVNILPEGFHHKNLSKQSLSKEEDLELVKKFNHYAEVNDIYYIYTVILKKDKIYFVASNATDEDLEKNNGGFYFYHYDDAAPYVYKAFKNKEPSFHNVTDQWGSFRSVFIPYTAADGTIYLAGADIQTGYIYKLLQEELLRTLIISFIFLLAAIPVFVAYASKIRESRNIEHKMDITNQASKAKSNFLASMSHELRTPLNAILGFSQLLEMKEDDKAKKENINEVIKASHYLLDLINEILDLSGIEAGKVQLFISSHNFSELFSYSLLMIQPDADKRSIRIVNHTNKFSDISISVDGIRFKQVLLNLLSNAIKYNRDNGEVIIDCSLSDENTLYFTITDTGIGLTPEQQNNLFIPFERVGAETSAIEGTGLGLVISKNLIELMGGSIGFESEIGKGTCFWVKVPLS